MFVFGREEWYPPSFGSFGLFLLIPNWPHLLTWFYPQAPSLQTLVGLGAH